MTKRTLALRLALKLLGGLYLTYFIVMCGIANLTCRNQRLLLPWGKMVVQHSCNYSFH